MAMAYATILLKEGSNYNQLHNEEIFFEALYEFTARVTNTKFDRKYWSIVESELGRLFRSPVRPPAPSRPLAPRGRGLTARLCALRAGLQQGHPQARAVREDAAGARALAAAGAAAPERPPRPGRPGRRAAPADQRRHATRGRPDTALRAGGVDRAVAHDHLGVPAAAAAGRAALRHAEHPGRPTGQPALDRREPGQPGRAAGADAPQLGQPQRSHGQPGRRRAARVGRDWLEEASV